MENTSPDERVAQPIERTTTALVRGFGVREGGLRQGNRIFNCLQPELGANNLGPTQPEVVWHECHPWLFSLA